MICFCCLWVIRNIVLCCIMLSWLWLGKVCFWFSWIWCRLLWVLVLRLWLLLKLCCRMLCGKVWWLRCWKLKGLRCVIFRFWGWICCLRCNILMVRCCSWWVILCRILWIFVCVIWLGWVWCWISWLWLVWMRLMVLVFCVKIWMRCRIRFVLRLLRMFVVVLSWWLKLLGCVWVNCGCWVIVWWLKVCVWWWWCVWKLRLMLFLLRWVSWVFWCRLLLFMICCLLGIDWKVGW